jgi:hypothetical protein
VPWTDARTPAGRKIQSLVSASLLENQVLYKLGVLNPHDAVVTDPLSLGDANDPTTLDRNLEASARQNEDIMERRMKAKVYNQLTFDKEGLHPVTVATDEGDIE